MTVRRVLFAAAEVAPLAKAGGLADVAGSLPKALVRLGLDVRIVMPNYNGIDRRRFPRKDTGLRLNVPFDGINHIVRVFTAALPGSDVPVFLLDHPHYEGVGDIYYQDVTNSAEQAVLQVERFLFFSKAVIEFLHHSDWSPDVVHCHDWHTAAVPFFLSQTNGPSTLYTIHNLPLQGALPMTRFRQLLGMTPKLPAAALHDGWVNLAALGLASADALTTVSPTYAEEILSPEQGGGLDALLRQRQSDLTGIVNGLDTDVFDPRSDPAIIPFSAEAPEGKQENAMRLRAKLELQPGPLFGMVSRLTEQKGIAVVCDILDELVHLGGRLVVLGRGEAALERRLHEIAERLPHRVSVVTNFDEALARQIYAGSDFFLMPSRFEPCGLGQLIAMRYGSVPIVRRVGGLADTVRDLENGITFGPLEPDALLDACRRGLALMDDPGSWNDLRQRCMKTDHSWTQSARRYVQLYTSLPHHATK